jgi:hypothetical protein
MTISLESPTSESKFFEKKKLSVGCCFDTSRFLHDYELYGKTIEVKNYMTGTIYYYKTKLFAN